MLLIPCCSVYVEATRPTPTDLDEFQIGQTRDSVLERLGAPLSSAVESNGASCDLYELYTKGYGAGGKIPIAIAEGAADVVTLGLAEVLLTPTEGVTKNEKHPITFCYKEQKLVRMTGVGVPLSDQPPSITAGGAARVDALSAWQTPTPTIVDTASPSPTPSPSASTSPTPTATSTATLSPSPSSQQ